MNNEELKQLMEINTDLAKENNQMLKKIRGAQKRSSFFRVLYWLVIIGVAFGAFYYLQPFFNKAKQILGTIGGTAADLSSLSDLVKQVNGKK